MPRLLHKIVRPSPSPDHLPIYSLYLSFFYRRIKTVRQMASNNSGKRGGKPPEGYVNPTGLNLYSNAFHSSSDASDDPNAEDSSEITELQLLGSRRNKPYSCPRCNRVLTSKYSARVCNYTILYSVYVLIRYSVT